MVCSIERLVLGCRVEEENCLPLLSLNCPGSDFKLWGMPFYEKKQHLEFQPLEASRLCWAYFEVQNYISV